MATTSKAFRVKNGLIAEGGASVTTGAFNLAAGTTTYAPLVFTSGTNLTTATAGSVEYDGTSFYITAATGGRKTIATTDQLASATRLSGTGGTYVSGDVLIQGTGLISTSQSGQTITIATTATNNTGTVTSASIVSANGFAGTVATSTTTPAITLTTTVTGILKGNGTAISAATAGTDYLVPSGTYYIGTTSNAFNRASGSQSLTGVSIDGSAGSVANALSAGTGLSYATGTTFDGSTARTLNVATASTSTAGIVQLSDSTSTTSSTVAATSTAVKSAYDLAAAALPKSGGTMSGAIAMGSFKITGLADPTSAQDAATKAYVDSAVVGIDWKPSVRAATTTAGTLSTSFANGQAVDGVTLATGDRILIKDQATGSENGIYTVNASGAPTRATDADASAEVTAGLAVFVEEGTTNADSGWVLTTNAPITLGTTALVFTQFTGLGQVTAGTGLTKTGNTLAIDSTVLTASSTHTLTNKTFNTAGTGNSFSINGTAITAVTGTGSVVLASSPTLTTPTLGVASATSVNKVTITAPATGSTLTIADGKTLTASNTLTFTGTDGSTLNIGTGGTLGTAAYTASSSYQPIDADLTAIAALTGTSGFLKTNGSGTWSVDTATYLTTSTASSTYAPLASPALTGSPTLNSVATSITASTTGATSSSPWTSGTLFTATTGGVNTAAKLLIKIMNTVTYDIEVIEMLVGLSGWNTLSTANVYITQYGDVQSGSQLATVTATNTSGAVTITVTPATTNAHSVSVSGTVL